jgi:ABC-type dipeptide/oligopeptide/nickel transport system ATPase component
MVPVVENVSLCLHQSEVLGVVGETGSGKSMTMLSVMGLVPGRGEISSGSIQFGDRELVGLNANDYRRLRGRELAMVVQNASSALNPLERVGRQIRNVYEANTSMRGKDVTELMYSVLQSVGFREPAAIAKSYPHQLSGGMAQRVLIAVALGPDPRLVIADEPTSGLDTTVGVRVLETLRRRLEDSGASGIIVTHDLGVVANYCDRVLVMRNGRVIEESGVPAFFSGPKTDYGVQLLESHQWRGTFGEVSR